MSLTTEQVEAVVGSQGPGIPELSSSPRPGLALVRDEDLRPSFMREVDRWPSRIWSVWEAGVQEGMGRRLGEQEAQWTAYARIMRGKVRLPRLTVHQLPGGGFPGWAERLPARITWVYCQGHGAQGLQSPVKTSQVSVLGQNAKEQTKPQACFPPDSSEQEAVVPGGAPVQLAPGEEQ